MVGRKAPIVSHAIRLSKILNYSVSFNDAFSFFCLQIVPLKKQTREKKIHKFISQSHLRDSDKLGTEHASSFKKIIHSWDSTDPSSVWISLLEKHSDGLTFTLVKDQTIKFLKHFASHKLMGFLCFPAIHNTILPQFN